MTATRPPRAFRDRDEASRWLAEHCPVAERVYFAVPHTSWRTVQRMGGHYDWLHRSFFCDPSLASTFARYWKRLPNPYGDPVTRLPEPARSPARPVHYRQPIRVDAQGNVWTDADTLST